MENPCGGRGWLGRAPPKTAGGCSAGSHLGLLLQALCVLVAVHGVVLRKTNMHGEVLWEARGSAWGWKCSGSEQEGGLPSRGVRRSREKPFLSSLSDPWQRPRLGPDREGLQPAPLARGKLLPHQPLPLCWGDHGPVRCLWHRGDWRVPGSGD